jgi:Putative adhesin
MRMSLLVSTAVAALAAGTAVVRASDHNSDQQVSADPRGIVEVSNFSGKIEVSGWDQPQVSVHANMSNDINNVDVRSDHGRTTINVRMHGMSFGGGAADLSIRIPKASELDVTSVSADVTSKGIVGAQRLKTVSGSIKADISQSDVEAKTVSGSVYLHGDGKPASLHVTSISGSIRVEHGAGDVEANTVSGDLDVQLDPGRSVRVRTTSGRMNIQGKLSKDADVDSQTVSGDVKLHAAPQGGYDYELSTFSGDIRNCFNLEPEKTSRYGPGERLSGARGSGSGHVRIKTMSGQIDICDK